jgi:predicted RNase H-like HicB family nuclease
MNLRYYAAFVPAEDGRVSVFFPDVPGCVTWGKDIDDALAMSLEALEGHLEALADDGDPIPKPSLWKEALKKVRRDFETNGETLPDGIILQSVIVPDVFEKPARVNVSFRKSILTMIDRKAEKAGLSRSGFLSRAAEAYHTHK